MSKVADVDVGGYRVHILVDGDNGPVAVLCSCLGGAGCTGVTRSPPLRVTTLWCDSIGPAPR